MSCTERKNWGPNLPEIYICIPKHNFWQWKIQTQSYLHHGSPNRNGFPPRSPTLPIGHMTEMCRPHYVFIDFFFFVGGFCIFCLDLVVAFWPSDAGMYGFLTSVQKQKHLTKRVSDITRGCFLWAITQLCVNSGLMNLDGIIVHNAKLTENKAKTFAAIQSSELPRITITTMVIILPHEGKGDMGRQHNQAGNQTSFAERMPKTRQAQFRVGQPCKFPIFTAEETRTSLMCFDNDALCKFNMTEIWRLHWWDAEPISHKRCGPEFRSLWGQTSKSEIYPLPLPNKLLYILAPIDPFIVLYTSADPGFWSGRPRSKIRNQIWGSWLLPQPLHTFWALLLNSSWCQPISASCVWGWTFDIQVVTSPSLPDQNPGSAPSSIYCFHCCCCSFIWFALDQYAASHLRSGGQMACGHQKAGPGSGTLVGRRILRNEMRSLTLRSNSDFFPKEFDSGVVLQKKNLQDSAWKTLLVWGLRNQTVTKGHEPTWGTIPVCCMWVPLIRKGQSELLVNLKSHGNDSRSLKLIYVPIVRTGGSFWDFLRHKLSERNAICSFIWNLPIWMIFTCFFFLFWIEQKAPVYISTQQESYRASPLLAPKMPIVRPPLGTLIILVGFCQQHQVESTQVVYLAIYTADWYLLLTWWSTTIWEQASRKKGRVCLSILRPGKRKFGVKLSNRGILFVRSRKWSGWFSP